MDCLWACGIINLEFFKEQVYNTSGFIKEAIKELKVIKSYYIGTFSSRISKSLPKDILKQLYSSVSGSFFIPPTTNI